MPIGLSSNLPSVLQRCVYSAEAFVAIRAFNAAHPPASASPSMGISSAPAQIRINCKTSLKIAERNIDGNCQRGNPNAEVDVPPENNLEDQRHRIHVDSTHQHRHQREADGR